MIKALLVKNKAKPKTPSVVENFKYMKKKLTEQCACTIAQVQSSAILLKDELPCLLPLPAVGTGPRPAPGARLSWDLPSPPGTECRLGYRH